MPHAPDGRPVRCRRGGAADAPRLGGRAARHAGFPAGGRAGCCCELFTAELPALAGDRDFAEVTTEVLERWGLADRTEDVLAFWTRLELDAGGHRAHPRAAGRRRRLLPGHQPARAAARLHVHEPGVRRAAGRPAVLLRPRGGQARPGLLHRRARADRLRPPARRCSSTTARPTCSAPAAPGCAPRSSTSPPAPTRCATILAAHGLLLRPRGAAVRPPRVGPGRAGCARGVAQGHRWGRLRAGRRAGGPSARAGGWPAAGAAA